MGKSPFLNFPPSLYPPGCTPPPETPVMWYYGHGLSYGPTITFFWDLSLWKFFGPLWKSLFKCLKYISLKWISTRASYCMLIVCSTNQITSFHCTHPPQSSRLDRLNKPHMMSVGGYCVAERERGVWSPMLRWNNIFSSFPFASSPILPPSPSPSSIPTLPPLQPDNRTCRTGRAKPCIIRETRSSIYRIRNASMDPRSMRWEKHSPVTCWLFFHTINAVTAIGLQRWLPLGWQTHVQMHIQMRASGGDKFV